MQLLSFSQCASLPSRLQIRPYSASHCICMKQSGSCYCYEDHNPRAWSPRCRVARVICVRIDSDLPSLSTELVYPLDLPQTPLVKILPIFVVSEGFFIMYCIHGDSPIWIPIQVMYDSFYHDSVNSFKVSKSNLSKHPWFVDTYLSTVLTFSP